MFFRLEFITRSKQSKQNHFICKLIIDSSIEIEDWINKIQEHVPEGDIVIAMCATKCDLEDDPDTSQAEALAAQTGAIFFKTSAKTNSNVQLLFQKVTERVLDYQRNSTGLLSSDIPVTLGTTAIDTSSPLASSTDTSSNDWAKKSAVMMGNKNQQSSIAAASENGASANSPYIDEKKAELEDLDDVVDKKREMPDDSSVKHVNMSRCDTNKLMCGQLVGVSDDGSMAGCIIQ